MKIKKQQPKKKILIISYPINKNQNGVESYDYYSALVFLLTKGIQDNFMDTVDVILKIPSDHNTQIEFILKAVEDTEIDYIVVSPKNVSFFYHKDKLALIAPLIEKNKIIFIDQGFEYLEKSLKDEVAEEKIKFPPYVQANWYQGGREAGASAWRYLKNRKITAPHIVLIEGGIGSEPRIAGFEDYLKIKTSEADKLFFPTYFRHNSNYLKSDANEFFTKYLKESMDSKNPIDIIFCTNDEMALGVREALIAKIDFSNDANIHYHKSNQVPKIIGFDGILDLTLLLKSKNEDFIYDTILVGLDKQVKKIVEIISLQLEGRILKEGQKFITVDCESYRVLHNLEKPE